MGGAVVVEGGREHFLDPFDQDEDHVVPHFLRHVFQILFVGLGQNDPFDAGTVSREHFFFDPSDRKDQAAQADLAGHGRVAADRFPLI